MGIPFVLSCDDTATGVDLYREAWIRCRRIFMRKNTNEEHINHITASTEQLLAAEAEKAKTSPEGTEPSKDQATASSSKRPLLHEEHVSAFDGSCEYPFRLALTTSTFFDCSICPKKCTGCIIPCTDELPPWNKLGGQSGRVYIAVDWCHECLKENAPLEQSTTMVNKDHSLDELRPLKNRKYSLEQCLEVFLSEEQLDKNEEWYCSACKEHKRARKKIDIWKLPPILIIHLKRFHFTSRSHSKLSTSIVFPPEGKICLRPFVIGPDDGNQEVYRLYAVSNHYGGVGFGHYTAHCFNQTKGEWYDFNDDYTRQIKYEQLNGSSAYILFFERISKSIPLAISQSKQQQQQSEQQKKQQQQK